MDTLNDAREEHDDETDREELPSYPAPGTASERWSLRGDLEGKNAALRAQLNTSRRMYDMAAESHGAEIRRVRTETKSEIEIIERTAGEKIEGLTRRLAHAESQEKVASARADEYRQRVEAADRDRATVRRALEVLLANGFGDQQVAEVAALHAQVKALQKERDELGRRLNAATAPAPSRAYAGVPRSAA